jgi:hypothetical protein
VRAMKLCALVMPRRCASVEDEKEAEPIDM